MIYNLLSKNVFLDFIFSVFGNNLTEESHLDIKNKPNKYLSLIAFENENIA